MAEATIPQCAADKKAGRRQLIKDMFAEMDELHARMKRDREEINRLTPIIRANLDETDAILKRLAASRSSTEFLMPSRKWYC